MARLVERLQICVERSSTGGVEIKNRTNELLERYRLYIELLRRCRDGLATILSDRIDCHDLPERRLLRSKRIHVEGNDALEGIAYEYKLKVIFKAVFDLVRLVVVEILKEYLCGGVRVMPMIYTTGCGGLAISQYTQSRRSSTSVRGFVVESGTVTLSLNFLHASASCCRRRIWF